MSARAPASLDWYETHLLSGEQDITFVVVRRGDGERLPVSGQRKGPDVTRHLLTGLWLEQDEPIDRRDQSCIVLLSGD